MLHFSRGCSLRHFSALLASTGLACWATLLAACSDPLATEDTSSTQAGIVNGEVSNESEDAVVKLSIVGAQGCTGTLIAPNVVLTALHCVTYYSATSIRCNADGTPVTSTQGALGATVEPERIEVRYGVAPAQEPAAHAEKVFGTGSINVCSNDLAVLVLDRELDLPLSSIRLGRSTPRGERVSVVGYGQTEMPISSGRKRRGGLQVLDVGTDDMTPGSSKNVVPRTLVVGEGPCHGDSGGPAFSEETGAVIGVYSLLTSATCTTLAVRNVFTQVAPFESLIRSALEYAGQEPILEETEPVGSTGGTGAGGDSNPGGAPGSGGTGEPGEGGTVSSGGASSRGGSANPSGGSNGGSSGGSVAQAATGNEGETPDEGSGSRRDPSCACKLVGVPQHGALAWGVAGLALVLAARRRRTRAS